jgi:DEAD/DEAH box helicase domain-containing protein
MLDRLFEMTLQMIQACDCETGCPSCIHFATCGNGNVPLDKAGAIHLLELLCGHRTIDAESMDVSDIEEEPPEFADWETAADTPPTTSKPAEPHVVVFDLETQLSAAEVGGWNKSYLMRMSCGIVWDSREDGFTTYFEDQVDKLVAHLQRAELIVGFNVIGFDYSVLRGYTRFDFRELNTLDIMRDVHSHLNYRVSLDGLAQATLDTKKSADGLQALRWFKQGRLDLIEKYCRHDVEITRDLFRHGLDKGYLVFERKEQGKMRLPVGWQLQSLVTAGDSDVATPRLEPRRAALA